MVDVVVGGGCVEGEGDNGGLYMYVYIGSNCLIILKRRVGKVSSAMGRRETEGVRMIGAAASRQVTAPQVLVGEGQRQ